MRVTVLSSARWALFRLSKQYISQALARDGHDVLYVDPPLSVASIVRNRSRLADALAPTDQQVEDGLRLWRPHVVPGQNSGVGQRVNAAILRRGIRRRMPNPDLTIAFSLESRRLIARAPEVTVYYCTDSFEDQPFNDREETQARERELIAAADIVVACSRPLCDQLAERGAAPLYLPHAIDDDSLRPLGPVPERLQGLPRPLVGWAGSINWRVDLDMLLAARRAAEGGTLVAIGGGFTANATPAVRSLLSAPGVVAVGEVAGEDLPDYLAALDVGLVPYTPGPFNRKSFPIKVLQYLAAGIPVVSSRNGATDELGSTVVVADDPDAFEQGVRRALEDRSPQAVEHRRAVGRSRTWSENTHILLKEVSSLRR